MNEQEIISMLKHYYETDISNCRMTHEMWIDVVAKAFTKEGYLEAIKQGYKEYLEEINS